MKTTLVSKLKNWWWYYNKVILLALAAVAACLYMYGVNRSAEEADYHIGIVSAVPYTQEALAQMEDAFSAAGADRNQDGKVLVTLHTYYVDLADEDPNAGYKNYEIVTALDADLIGNTSGIFLLEDPDVFRQITGNILSDREIPWTSALAMTIREDASADYIALYDSVSSEQMP